MPNGQEESAYWRGKQLEELQERYGRLLTAARAVVEGATGLLDCDTACGQCRHVPTALLDALRAAVESTRDD